MINPLGIQVPALFQKSVEYWRMQRVLVADLSPNVSWTGEFYSPSVVLSLKKISTFLYQFHMFFTRLPRYIRASFRKSKSLFATIEITQKPCAAFPNPAEKNGGLPGQVQILAIFHSHLQLKLMGRNWIVTFMTHPGLNSIHFFGESLNHLTIFK